MVVVRVLPFVVLLAVWWLVSGNPFVTPPPDVVWQRALDDDFALRATLVTFGRVLIAFALAGVVGVALGTLIGCVGFVRRAFQPLVAFLFPVPKIALYPAMLIILGLGSASKIGLGFAEAVFPILLATAAATARVEPALVWSARALGTRHTLARVVVPAALPGILTGARIGLIGAIIGVFLAEMTAGADGLGHMMAVAYRTLDTPAMYVAIIAVSAAGLALDRAFLLVRDTMPPCRTTNARPRP